MVAAGLDLGADFFAVIVVVLHTAVGQQLSHGVIEHGFNRRGHVVKIVDRGVFHHIERIVQRRLVLFLGDEVVVIHALEHIIRAVIRIARLTRAVIVAARVVFGGVSRDGGQRCAFAQRQLTQAFAEVTRRGLDAVVALAQRDGVEIPFQNLILGVFLFQLDGKICLLNFALVALLGGEQLVLDELLGDGGTALRGIVLQVGHESADDALDVNAIVGVEACVLDRHKGLSQLIRNLVKICPDAVFRPAVGGDQIAVAVVDKGGQVLGFDLFHVQLRRGVVIGLSNAHHQTESAHAHHKHYDQQQRHRRAQHGEYVVRLSVTRLKE